MDFDGGRTVLARAWGSGAAPSTRSKGSLSAEGSSKAPTYRQLGEEIHQIPWRHDYGSVQRDHVAVPQLQVEVRCQKLF